MNNQAQQNINISEILKQNENLRKLTQITTIINASLDIGKLLNTIMESIKDIMHTEAGSLLFYDESTDELVFKVAVGEKSEKLTEQYRFSTSEGIAGWCAKNRKAIIVNDAYQDDRFNPNFDKLTGFFTRAIICAPLLFKGKLIGVIEGINPINRNSFADEDMGLFNLFADQAVMAVQNAIIFEKAVEERRIHTEIMELKSVLDKIIKVGYTSSDFPLTNTDIAAASIASKEISGEFLNITELSDGRISAFICDSRRSGFAGAIYNSFISGILKSLLSHPGLTPGGISKVITSAYNNTFKTAGQKPFFSFIYDPVKKTFDFSETSYGHVILKRNNIAKIINKNAENNETLFKTYRLNLNKDNGDMIIIFTEGILNLRNKKSKQFNMEMMMETVNNSENSTTAVIKNILDSADHFTESVTKKDDFSIIVLKI